MNFTVEDAVKDRFREGTTPRSEAYKAGFLERLHRIIDGKNMEPFPFTLGTPEADAYFSGQDHAAEYCKARTDSPLYD